MNGENIQHHTTYGNSSNSSDSTSNYTTGNSDDINLLNYSQKNFDDFLKKEKIFVSKPFYKIFLWNGAGFYFLNSYKFRIFPKFFFMKRSTFIEFGIDWLGVNAEFMWNKAFER
jgi:hypothetical protein